MDSQLTQPSALLDLAEYRPGSVVSRVLYRNGGGTLTLFAFAEGEGLTEHTNTNDAVVHVLEGSVRIVCGGEEHQVHAGQSLHLPANVPHSLEGGSPFKMLLTLLKRSPST